MTITPAGTPEAASVDPAEIARFEAMAAEWWDPRGKFRPLHLMNPCRLAYAVAQIAAEHGREPREKRPFAGLRILDLGCGGGLMAEPMARLGAEVVGIDASPESIGVARTHATQAGLAIDYRVAPAEALVAAGERFDALLCMEVVEHVPDPAAFLRHCAALLAPGGVMVASTLNRTLRSWLLAIVAAERVLGWLPPGTHDWHRFLRPDELRRMVEAAGLEWLDARGMVFDPLTAEWRLSETVLAVNYAVTARRPAASPPGHAPS